MCRVRASLSPSESGLSEQDLQCQAGRNGLAKINSAGHMSYWLLLGERSVYTSAWRLGSALCWREGSWRRG